MNDSRDNQSDSEAEPTTDAADTPADAGDKNTSKKADGDEPAARKQSFKRRHWGKLTILSLVALPVMGVCLWTLIALNWSYSDDAYRAGYLQKISHKGWLCKTWEGTLYTDISKGFRSDSFMFSVRGDSIARVLQTMSGRKVSIHYEQHRGIPTSCFGESQYFVNGVQIIPE